MGTTLGRESLNFANYSKILRNEQLFWSHGPEPTNVLKKIMFIDLMSGNH